jgi:hypothetical protein
MIQQRSSALWTLEEYTRPSGASRIKIFFDGLSRENKKIARNLLGLLEEFGNEVEPPRTKALGRGLHELRKGEIRIFYTFLPGRRAVIIDGLVKKRDDIPPPTLSALRVAVKHIHDKEKHKNPKPAPGIHGSGTGSRGPARSG